MKVLLKLWPYFKKYKARLVVMVTCGLLMSLCQGTVVPLGAYLFDKIFSHSMGVSSDQLSFVDHAFAATLGTERETLVWAIPLSLVVLYLINGLSRYIHVFLMRHTGDWVSIDLKRDLQRQYLDLNLSFHHNYKLGSGGLISRTSNDVGIVQTSTGVLADMIREPILALYLIGYMIYMDWRLTICLFVAAPVIVIMLRQISRSLRKYGHLHQEAHEAIVTIFKESLDGIKVIQSFNLENHILKRFNRVARDYLNARRSVLSREELVGPISEFIGVSVFAAMAIYFGQKVIAGQSSPGVFVSFVIAMGFMQKPIRKTQDAFVRLQQTVVSTTRIFEILEDSHKVPEVAHTRPFPSDWNKIHFQNIHFSYSDEKILDAVDFQVQRGSVIALVGSSGSGKSTLVHLLERFFDPTQGQILIDDTPITQMPLHELRQNIALVSQDVFLFNDTLENNIRFGHPNEKQRSLEEASRLANAFDFIDKLPEKFQTLAGDRGCNFSGGEKQRLSIARAIYKDAPILILDEATSALDSVSEIEVQKGLEKLMLGRTVFVIAHRLSTVQKADQILVLSNGRIAESGTHDELLSQRGEYFAFHQLQTQVTT